MTQPHLHRQYPGLAQALPYQQLGSGPSPVRPLAQLSENLWLKDDGAYGDGGWGGNKVRKLEWLLPDVRRRGRTTMLTVGGLGTNWGLAAALYGREQGLDTVLALVDQPVDEHVLAQLERLKASGAVVHRTHTKARTMAIAPWLLMRHSRRGRFPYFLPPGGSSPLGVVGYVEAAFEIAEQVRAGELPEPTHVVCPVGSGGTVAGLALGLRLAGLKTRAVGIVVNDTLRLDAATLARLANRCADLLRSRGAALDIDPVAAADIDIHTRWIGTGYGHPLSEVAPLQQRSRDAEGLDLDPVYTGKAMAGALALLESGELGDGPVLFLHTDGPR